MNTEKRVRRAYSEEFIAEAVRMVQSGERKQSEVARSLGVSNSTMSKWCRLAAGGSAIEAARDSSKDAETIRRLEAENRRLKLEQELLKKAAAYFAKNLP